MATKTGRPRVNPLPPLAARPYDQAPGEPDDDYARFLAYYQLGRDRTLLQVAEQENVAHNYVRNLSSKWAWPARVAAFETASSEYMLERHARLLGGMQVRILERQLESGAAIEDTLAAADLLERIASMDIKDRLAALVAFRRDNRAAAGIPDARALQVTGAGGGPVQVETVEKLDEHHAAWAEQLAGDLAALELTAAQRAVLAQRWAARAAGDDPDDRTLQGELAS